MSGWDEPKPPSTGGKLLILKEQGQKVRVRFYGSPVKVPGEFDGKPNVRWCCKVILKTAVNSVIEREAKAFVFAPMIYYAVADLWRDPDWGNPEAYDVEIERTEEKGKYYVVVPKPNCKPISDEEKAMLEALDVDLADPFGSAQERIGAAPHSEGYDPFEDD